MIDVFKALFWFGIAIGFCAGFIVGAFVQWRRSVRQWKREEGQQG